MKKGIAEKESSNFWLSKMNL